MSKTRIEWLKSADGKPGYTINPVKGLCPMACPYCYARRMYERFHWDENLFFVDDWAMPLVRAKPSRVFVGSTMELFGTWIEPRWRANILAVPKSFPQHTFIFLTKQPHNLPKEWPDNCWVGVSATDAQSFYDATKELFTVDAKVKFISFEPLLGQINGGECEGKRLDCLKYAGINWIILGQQTPIRALTSPKIEWIKEIIEAADRAKIPVFEKNNLQGLLNRPLRQEFPFVPLER